ncbi:glycoprotein 3-alpha-L-fucosyltransferase A-like [Anthonomus grandis grandis]|uniref:glycoprotein 3-alpha-L-fucosyltransferase A-like n=1 Tax=Anthonomus grandis grandis TaxID=2921223 RepID=UPI0021661B85|nr:glycoprotein 3-alpha-L-fucosyltransferase A-like [Anthonomus grandis grandis]XP_050302320.1 glycoprotein 3-alpha-L-fucosyltransferase A-like [Anthonomus grandis grandis]XP_050302321.1 glycoprotein 3-alpha-L-fucosyltransferase A-like [Anthonomus grandis grandis]
MPPRLLTPRKFFLTFLVVIGVTLLVGSKYRFSYFSKSSREHSLREKDLNGVEEHTQKDEMEKDEVELEEEKQPTKPLEKPFFLSGGTLYPSKTKGPARLFPEQADGDRIVDQLMYVPEDYQEFDTPEKTILLFSGLGAWGQRGGSAAFAQCPVSRCSLTADRGRASDADAILFKDHVANLGFNRPANQVWILYHLECPYHTQSVKIPESINWTATYRRDSDIVAPYEKWVYYDPEVRQINQNKDYAGNKTKKVAWFVSNCGARNNRLQYARELAKYIEVDIYGGCGSLKCPRSDDKKCFNLLESDYKFYFAFENSNCRDYITEKLFVNGLGHDVLPIVMGARPEDYQKSTPEGSYIHVDEFAGPEELAEYLHRLDNDNALYNSYFKWKGTGEFINTYFWCRLCAMLHAPLVPRHYEDVNDWWRGPGVCTTKSWRNAEFV